MAMGEKETAADGPQTKNMCDEFIQSWFSQALQFVFVVLKPSKYHLSGKTGYLFQPIEISVYKYFTLLTYGTCYDISMAVGDGHS